MPIEQLKDGSGTPIDEARFVSDFAAALNQMLDSSQLREFGEAGRTRVEQHFSWSSIADQTLSVYRRAIDNFK